MIYDEAIKSGVLVDLFTKEAFEELFIPEPRKNNIREYGEGQEVEIDTNEENGRLTITAFNQCGYDATSVDLLDVLDWVKANKPELLTEK